MVRQEDSSHQSGWHREPPLWVSFYRDQNKSKFRIQASLSVIQAMIAVPFDTEFIGKLDMTIGVTALKVEGFNNCRGRRS